MLFLRRCTKVVQRCFDRADLHLKVEDGLHNVNDVIGLPMIGLNKRQLGTMNHQLLELLL